MTSPIPLPSSFESECRSTCARFLFSHSIKLHVYERVPLHRYAQQHDWPLDEADFRPVSPAPSDQTNARGGPHREETNASGGPHREELLRSEDKAAGVANHQQQTVEAAVVVPVPVAGREDDARTADVNKVGKRGKKKTKGKDSLFHDASDLYEPPSIEELAGAVAGAGHVQTASTALAKFSFAALMEDEEAAEGDDL